MAQDYSKWPESCWASDHIDWNSARSIQAGVDIGTTSSQAAILCDGKLFGTANMRTGTDFRKTADAVIDKAMGETGMSLKDIGSVVATGFGKRNVAYATEAVDEIHCHAKGARFLFGPEVLTVVDLGAQTCKAIRLFDWDRVRDFMVSDICATGMGRNIETVCNLLQIPVTEIGMQSLDLDQDPEPVSTTCFVFAETETMGLFRPGYREEPFTPNEVCAAHLLAVAWRILGVVGKLQPQDAGDIKVYEKLCFTGGLAKNQGIVKRLERELNTTAAASDHDPMLAGAIGAALLAGGQEGV
jgi:predicted CoA-substrate-specific enzyme activase